MMPVLFTRNDNDTWNTIDRQTIFPTIDSHCHVFGQSLLASGDDLHKWSDPKNVTFVKQGTNGKTRKTFPPAVLVEIPLSKMKLRAKQAAAMAKAGTPDSVKDRAKKELENRGASAADNIKDAAGGDKVFGNNDKEGDPLHFHPGSAAKAAREQPKKQAKQFGKGVRDQVEDIDARTVAEQAVSEMEDLENPEEITNEIEDTLNGIREAKDSVSETTTHKVYARGVVEVPKDAPWPPRATTKQIGNRMYFVVRLTEDAEILSTGAGMEGSMAEGAVKLAAEVIDIAQFGMHFLGSDGENARYILDGMPSYGGKAAVALLLDMGYTPLHLPGWVRKLMKGGSFVHSAMRNAPVIGLPTTWTSEKLSESLRFPKATEDPTGLYREDRKYIHFDRTGFQATVEAFARVNAEHAYKIWCMVPFDPRRAWHEKSDPPKGKKALEMVKHAIDDLGFAGVKVYTRCGWMPYNNEAIHGDEGPDLDAELDELYEYVVEEELPMLNHGSPGGFPPDPCIAYPKPYDSEDLYHVPPLKPKWGEIGFAPLPLGLKSLIPDSLDEWKEELNLPSPEDVRKQAQSLGSKMLQNTGKFVENARDRLTKDSLESLRNAQHLAREHGRIDQMSQLADPKNWDNPRTHRDILKYFDNDESKLREVSSRIDLPEFFELSSQVEEADTDKLLDIADPDREVAGTLEDEAGKIRNPLDVIFDRGCKFLAHRVCSDAGKFCHYVQHTASPHSWEPVLKKYPDLRLCLAHAGSGAAAAAYYMEKLDKGDKTDADDKEFLKKIEEEFKGEDEDDFTGIRTYPFIGNSEQFKKYFADCAKNMAKSHILTHFASVEAAVSSIGDKINENEYAAGTLGDIIDTIFSKLKPLFIKALDQRYSLEDLSEGIQEQIPEVLDSKLWKKWFEDWEEQYEDGWFKKMLDLMNEYDHVYTDISNWRVEEKSVQHLLSRLAEDALSDDGDLAILKERLMIGTDWYMGILHETDVDDFWAAIQSDDDHDPPLLNREHPLWELWTRRNVIEFMNLGPRMKSMEKFYESRNVAEDAEPSWWEDLKAHYGVEDDDEDGDDASSGASEQDDEEDNEKDEAEEYEEYTIKEGDWLSKIAPNYDMTWQELYSYDGGTGKPNKQRLKSGDPDLIYPGEVIVVPKK